jgi:hypothetical protein
MNSHYYVLFLYDNINFNLIIDCTFYQVNVQMEYSRKIDGPAAATGPADSRVMDFGSVFLLSPIKAEGDDTPAPAPPTSTGQAGVNVAELVVARGFGTVIRHRDFEERSNFYDALLAAESRAIAGKKGIHSARDPPVMHITDLVTVRNVTFYDKILFLLSYPAYLFYCVCYLCVSFRLRPRKLKIFCRSCNGVGKFLPLWNMSSVVIVLSC